MKTSERILTEIIVLYEAIHSVKADYSADKPIPEELLGLIEKWNTRIKILKDKLRELNKY